MFFKTNKWIYLFILIQIFSLPYAESLACTRILVNDKDNAVMVGRNMDWAEDTKTNLMVYPRNMARSGISPDGDSKGNWISWVSKYGSIVATGYENLTSDGFNEAGLAAHIFWYEDADYGTRDQSKAGLSLTVWTQYYLDNFKSVAEAVRFTETNPFQIVPFFHPATNQWGKMHLILDDASGDSAILEHDNGKLRIYHGREYLVATNEPSFDKHLKNLKRYKVFGGTLPLPGKTRSQDRFVRATYFAKQLPQANSIQEEMASVLGILNNTAHPFTPNYRTYWHTVSDLTNKVYYFQSVELQNVIKVSLDKFDLGATPVLKLDLINHPEYVGDMSDKFEPVIE
jgi:choloylglycine hydrolase